MFFIFGIKQKDQSNTVWTNLSLGSFFPIFTFQVQEGFYIVYDHIATFFLLFLPKGFDTFRNILL